VRPPESVTVVDLDGDGRVEQIATHLEDDRIVVHHGSGALQELDGSDTRQPLRTYVSDVDGDGDHDLRVELSGGGYVLFHQDGPGRFTVAELAPSWTATEGEVEPAPLPDYRWVVGGSFASPGTSWRERRTELSDGGCADVGFRCAVDAERALNRVDEGSWRVVQ